MNKRRTIVIIQAREHSKRLDGKIFKKIKGISLLEIILQEIKRSNLIDNIVVASSKNTNKKKLDKIVRSTKCVAFYGSEKNVLSRFKQISNDLDCEIIIRLTADNVLISYKFIEEKLKFFIKNKKIDYASNLFKCTYPEGYTFEIFNKKTLKKIVSNNYKIDREHVTASVVKKLTRVKTYNFKSKIRFNKNLRLTCDNLNDLYFLKKLFTHIDLKKRLPSLERIQKIVNDNAIPLRNIKLVERSIHYKKN
tara:strand:- start:1662 stop:2411 length:750 start_codon:yes stop_codon:yes gene_type:complete